MDIIDIARIIIGQNGRRTPEYGGIDNAWAHGLLASFYGDNKPSDKTVYHYLAHSRPMHHYLTNTYASPDHYPHILADMWAMCSTITSLHRLRRIQADVHEKLTSLPKDTLGNLEAHHVAIGASRSQIATYLADVIHGVAIMHA